MTADGGSAGRSTPGARSPRIGASGRVRQGICPTVASGRRRGRRARKGQSMSTTMTFSAPTPTRSVRAVAAVAVAAALAVLAPVAQARNVKLMESVPDTLRVSRAHEILGDLDLRFGGDSGRGASVVRRDVTVVGEGSTQLHDVGENDGVRPSDHDLCARAFEDAITQLAFAARGVHATAIVGVVSAYEGTLFDDPGHFECHAGAIKAYVTLRAQLAVSVPVVSPPPVPVYAPPPPVDEPAPAPSPTFQPLPPAPAPTPN